MGLHFLVVSDQPNLRFLLVALLKEIGFAKISEAENGEMALRALKTTKFIGAPIEFILTDCAMPLMERFNVPALVRASFSFYNTYKEIDILVEGLNEVKKVFGG